IIRKEKVYCSPLNFEIHLWAKAQRFLSKARPKHFVLKNVEVGNYEDWIKYSDHVPIIIDFED
ncbi:MAG: hypothetical protein QS98_C0002G0123, partial [archaeon GW2011_AR3]